MESFLGEVAAHLYETQGNSLTDTAVIFVNKRPANYMQQHLATLIGRPFWSPSFFTTQEFFALSSDKEIADSYTQFFTLLEQYNLLMQREGAEPLAPEAFYGIAQTMLQDFNQVDAELVDARVLYTELEDIALIEQQFAHLSKEQQDFLGDFWSSFSPGKQQAQQEIFIKMWRRMPELYLGFHASLNARGMTTSGQIYRELAEGRASKADFIEKFDKLAFVGFNALSKTESVIFRRWQKEERTLFYFDTDAYYMQDEIQEAGLFLRKNTGRFGLVNALGPDRPLIREHPKSVRVYKAAGHIAQAKLLASSLAADYALLREKEQMGRIAVVLGDETLLFPVLQTIPALFPDDSGQALPVNVTMGFPLISSGIYGFADLYLSVQEAYLIKTSPTVYYRQVEAFLSHPLTGLPELTRNTLLRDILLEGLVEVPVAELVQVGELSTLFFAPLTDSLQAITQLYAAFELILYRQLDAGLLQKTDSELLARVLKELNQLIDALSAFADRLSVSFVLALIRKVLQGISVPLEGEPLQGIQIMGLLESRGLDFEHVYVLGVTEGHLPKTSRTPSFIPDSIRRAYDLPVPENQDAISAYMFYRLLQRSESLSLVYNGQTDSNNSGEPSRFLRQLEFESNYQFTYIQQDQDIALQGKIRFEVPKAGEVLANLNRYLQGKGVQPIGFSASALKTYLTCPMQFFFKYVAGLKEAVEIKENIEARTIGTIVHAVMEDFYRELMSSDPRITRERIAASRKGIPELSRQAFIRELLGKNTAADYMVKGMQEVVLAIVEKYVKQILDHDEKVAPFTLIELENKQDYTLSFPVVIGGESESLLFKAIIDRVDEKGGITRIVDYKTGSDELKFTSVEGVFETDTAKPNMAMVQTMFYTYIYEQVRGVDGVEPNLYLVKTLGGPKSREQAKTVFNQGSKVQLQAETLAGCKADFELALRTKIEEIFNPELPFRQTAVDSNCDYCPYRSVCGK